MGTSPTIAMVAAWSASLDVGTCEGGAEYHLAGLVYHQLSHAGNLVAGHGGGGQISSQARTTRTWIPRSVACASVSPAAVTWGSVKGYPGHRGAGGAGRPSSASTAIRAWYLPMWVRRARPFASPTAYSHPPGTPAAQNVSSTGTGRPG